MWSTPCSSADIVGSAVATIVWSSAARNTISSTPVTIVVTSRSERAARSAKGAWLESLGDKGILRGNGRGKRTSAIYEPARTAVKGGGRAQCFKGPKTLSGRMVEMIGT